MDSNIVSADMYFVAETQGYKCSLNIRYGVPPEKPLVGEICKDYLELTVETAATAFQLSS